ncbi:MULTISPECIES: type VI secretion system lipoprotein TssJ [unclassified Pseudomonas]|jgi:type VI secretion system protein VasD|uniref:type VI secretion system lipoprotein TssJ n=1 Tax=unclassified Pseudomonas TaxID=196821 RepID=UPI0008C2D3F5|nr:MULTISPECIES: type VI secretion system lipoprotein TssJ [unclassified Pseudomonas]PMV20346.1 type VI secretion system lipoprotein TssJ [Pseudomonas sp. FW305-3-2-15-C-TSA2]PMV21546.1 type VI secretion system lipoprotein TssJ [Pseudomonas sp. DP16D-L5]PMV36606.1 type VI secretion system lipoprotein TssJ [Pseudomonas sp. FW305-3-2-15-A-LB2]PMV43232.1 type VI secretion system lipoprotein TssJ [Pseudomonas sp. FW305-3-2-15-C-R2A1]PMV44792.1 type VI secretion system lipoprotein TssJ [Pseudomonas
MIGRSRVAVSFTLLLLGLLAGCSTLSPFSTLTKLDLTLTASDEVNPDLHGRPSPVVVQLLELRHPVAFENADFFSLYGRAEQALPKDWVSGEELELRPGERLALKLSVEPRSRYVGVLAAYRDLPHVQWRWVLPVAPGQLTRADIVLDQTGIRMAAPQPDRTED